MPGVRHSRFRRVMDTETFNRVKELLVESVGVSEHEVSPEATLFGDLGIDGDDAYDLFVDFAERFAVDMTGFVLSRHFGPEAGGNPVTALYIMARTLLYGPHRAAGVVPVKVADLVEAAERGKWPRLGGAGGATS